MSHVSRGLSALGAVGLAFGLSACVTIPEASEDASEPQSLAQQHAASEQVVLIETSEAEALKLPGVAAYRYDSTSGELVEMPNFKPTDTVYPWYSVATTGEGAWMVEVRPVSEFPQEGALRDVEPFKATGEMRTIEKSQPAYRPSSVIFWVPNSALTAEDHSYLEGDVLGEFPDEPPPVSTEAEEAQKPGG